MRSHVLGWLEEYMRADVAALLAPSWFTCIGLAGLVGLLLMLALAPGRKIDPGAVGSAVLWGYVAAVVAGIAMPMLIGAVERLATTGHLHLRWSGMTSFWGYLGGALAVVLVCRRDRVPLARMADLAVLPLGVALVFARLGCFMAGCDYGKVTAVPWAVRFPAGSPAWRDHVHAGLMPADRAASLPVHPTQLYEALLGIAIIAIAIIIARRPRRREGHMFLIAAAVYSIGRLFVETLRGDLGRGIYAGLSSGQIFSILVLLAVAFVLVRRRSATVLAAMAALALASFGGVARAQPSPPPYGPQLPDAPAPEPAAPEAPAPEAPVTTPGDAPPVEAPFTEERPAIGYVWNERPMFSVGAMFGVASALDRRADQVSTLVGPSLSFGYLPGFLGFWFDYDRFASSDATHSTLLASASVSYRPQRHVMLAARGGLGFTLVDFSDRVFADVTSPTVRIEAIAEYAFVRHWALWVRPLSIDVISADELGGSITTYQFRVGVAYRFGSRKNARAVPVRPPVAQPMLSGVP